MYLLGVIVLRVFFLILFDWLDLQKVEQNRSPTSILKDEVAVRCRRTRAGLALLSAFTVHRGDKPPWLL